VKPVLIYSMSVSVDGFIADREGAFGWTAPSEEQFRFHTALVSEALWQGRSGQPKDTSAPGTVDGTDEAEAV
jgi:hypothetical protein